MRTEVRAGEIRSALHEETLPDLIALLLGIAFCLLAPNWCLARGAVGQTIRGCPQTTLLGPIGDGRDAAVLKDIESGVVPQLRFRCTPT